MQKLSYGKKLFKGSKSYTLQDFKYYNKSSKFVKENLLKDTIKKVC